MQDVVADELRQTVEVLQMVAEDRKIRGILVAAAKETAAALLQGRKLLVAGNGGSAADAQHLAAEFVSRLVQDRPALRAIALTTDSSILTAVGNDYGYECVFARQVEALGLPGDVFFAISTSGNSPNILRALDLARSIGLVTIGLTGAKGGQMAPLCDFCLCAPSAITMKIQEAHLALEHIFCLLVEKVYFSPPDVQRPDRVLDHAKSR